ncbi:MAG: B12-binding domain-containing radical SAM protein, partial [Planctomycetota bacterium]
GKIPPARRDILNKPKYEFRGVKMFDLVQATRGCEYNCYPCCVPKLRGTANRTRPVAEVIEELRGIDNDRIFFIDNCLRQNESYQREFFTALKDLNLAWVAHPISEEEEILKLAKESGAWYIYQAIDRINDTIRDRIVRFHDHGIGVEGTILLGRDSHDKDFFKRMVDFLLEMKVELAEFTILTPFPNLGLFKKLETEGRILHTDWSKYNTAKAVYKPALMSPEELEEGYRWSWETFYNEDTQMARMAQLHIQARADLAARRA